MGVYSTTVVLKCTGTHPSVLTRFGQYWTPTAAAQCSAMAFSPYDAPDEGIPDEEFVEALQEFVMNKFKAALRDDINVPTVKIPTVNDVLSINGVSGVNPWSVEAATLMHEGGPTTIQVNYKDSGGSQQQDPWRITATGGQTGLVQLYIAWRYT